MTDPILTALADIPVAAIADAQDRFGVPIGIAPTWRGARLAGRAVTVETRSGDNLFIHKALTGAPAGSVIVVNGFGDLTRALIGDLIATTAVAKGIAGFVIDGVIRDLDAIAALGLPVFARGISPAGPYKNGPGHLDRPIAVGGVVVCPGDIVIGDTDGIVIVSRERAADVLARTETLIATEESKRITNSRAQANRR